MHSTTDPLNKDNCYMWALHLKKAHIFQHNDEHNTCSATILAVH
jgi:hypothetical protein